MEERWFQVGDTKPVTEGDLTLRVSRMLASRLKKLGATVLFVRNSTQPITSKRPGDFKELAKKILIKNGVPAPRPGILDPNDPMKEQTVHWQSEMLFYRYSEIRRRAVLVNNKLHPDLVLCLHFNAEGWGDPSNPTLIDNNHLHLLVNGSYLQDELDLDDERIQAGDYEGAKEINGVARKSIFREYADSVAEGLAEYYSKIRCSGGL